MGKEYSTNIKNDKTKCKNMSLCISLEGNTK